MCTSPPIGTHAARGHPQIALVPDSSAYSPPSPAQKAQRARSSEPPARESEPPAPFRQLPSRFFVVRSCFSISLFLYDQNQCHQLRAPCDFLCITEPDSRAESLLRYFRHCLKDRIGSMASALERPRAHFSNCRFVQPS